MSNYKYFIFLLILGILFPTSVLSKFVSFDDINSNSSLIQVGIFKERKNILKINKYFFNETLYIKKSKKFYLVYIVNIEKNELSKKLSKIKKRFPDAFVVKKKFVLTPKNSLDIIKSIDSKKRLQRNILNSKSILLTRKKII